MRVLDTILILSPDNGFDPSTPSLHWTLAAILGRLGICQGDTLQLANIPLIFLLLKVFPLFLRHMEPLRYYACGSP